MKARLDLVHHLRDRILGELHVGTVRPGGRLPGIREIAKLTGKNQRTVAHAYRALAAEGLVEIRGRSGVYAALQEVIGEGASQETARWLSSIIAEGWRRRFPATTLPNLILRCTQSTKLRCGLVEVVEDAIVAMRYELVHDWGFDVAIIDPELLAKGGGQFTGIDFFAATNFLAPKIHHAVETLRKTLVVLTVHAGLQAAIHDRLRAGRLTVIAVDPGFEERIRVAYGADNRQPDRVRVVLADDAAAIRSLDRHEPVLLTRAAHNRLGAIDLTAIFPHSPTLSSETARSLANTLVLHNLATFGAIARED